MEKLSYLETAPCWNELSEKLTKLENSMSEVISDMTSLLELSGHYPTVPEISKTIEDQELIYLEFYPIDDLDLEFVDKFSMISNYFMSLIPKDAIEVESIDSERYVIKRFESGEFRLFEICNKFGFTDEPRMVLINKNILLNLITNSDKSLCDHISDLLDQYLLKRLKDALRNPNAYTFPASEDIVKILLNMMS